MYNNDKRIVPSGGKHFTHWRWRRRRGGGAGRGDFLVDEHIRYMVHSDKWRETTRYTERKPQIKKQSYEILMGYIY